MSSIAQCGQCGKYFSEAYNLKRHIRRIHDGQRDYECKSCDKSFFEEYDLKRHIRRNHEDDNRAISDHEKKKNTSSIQSTKTTKITNVIHVVHILLKQDL